MIDRDLERRVAFVGRGVLHRPHTLTAPAGGLQPAFFEWRSDTLREDLEAFAPDVVVVFTPDRLPSGLVAELDAVAVAYLPEVLAPDPSDDDENPVLDEPRHPDVWDEPPGEALTVDGFDVGEYDRIVVTDPMRAARITGTSVWRSAPLPVADELFLPLRPPPRRPKPLFIGPSNEHVEGLLINLKHQYDLSHVAFGLTGERLRRALEQASVGIVLNESRTPRFQPNLPLHLAAGHLVVAETLNPTRGFEPGLDHLRARSPYELQRHLDQLAARPTAWDQIRRRGRLRAEAFRASRAWPRLLADLAVELRAR